MSLCLCGSLTQMKLLPVALNVQDKQCLIVGGGPVAQRKAAALLECGARVTVVAPVLCDCFAPLLASVEHVKRVYRDGDCDGYDLIFACTGDRDTNEEVMRVAQMYGIWCNVADDPGASDFHSAATVRRGDICIGITTTGGSPALSRHLKAIVADGIGPEYEQLLDIMSARRAALPDALDRQAERAGLWRAILNSDALNLLKHGKRLEAEALVDGILGDGP